MIVHVRHRILLLALAVFSALLPTSPLAAQVIRGHIVDQVTQAPIQGAFILLLDSAGTRQASVLSGSTGAFILKAPRAGTYTLRAERIGDRSTDSDLLQVTAGRALAYRFEISVKAVDLEGLQVTGEKGQCHLSREMGAQTSMVWEEIRKALSIAAWGDEIRGVPYRTATWTRLRKMGSLKILDDTVLLHSGYGRAAFASESAKRLGERGFIRAMPGGGLMFYGLDAEELLSDAFLTRHCFRVVEDDTQPGLTGLAFEPVPYHRFPDIYGTLWVDRANAELRTLEFTYERIPLRGRLPRKAFGGHVDFRRLDNGDWVVSRWWLRMPETMRSGENLHTREKGGEIRFIGNAAPPDPDATFVITGTVYDSTAMAPLRDATVFLTDVNVSARTDVFGRFRLGHIPLGTHRIAFMHPRADLLRLPIVDREIDVRSDRTTTETLTIPRNAGCGPARSTGGIVGFVEGADGGEPLAGRMVQVEWSSRTASGGGRVTRMVRRTTDSAGRFVVCGLPMNTDVRLAAEDGRTYKVTLHEPGLLPQTLVAPGPEA